MARDEELLRLAAASGCLGMFIGLESLSPENLEKIGKRVNLVDIKQAIGKIHRHGIAIEGAFIFGLDYDDETVFERTLNFAEEVRLEGAQFGVLTPFPGTMLYQEMEKTNRILDRDWGHYTVNRVVFQPLLMSARRLQGWTGVAVFSYSSLFKRLGPFKKLMLLWSSICPGPGLYSETQNHRACGLGLIGYVERIHVRVCACVQTRRGLYAIYCVSTVFLARVCTCVCTMNTVFLLSSLSKGFFMYD